jgi:phosphoglycerate dehydrogenase-like enzyme
MIHYTSRLRGGAAAGRYPPLRELDNLLMAPHAAGSTADASRLAPFMAADDVIRVLKGERALYALNPEIYQS